MGDPFDLDAFVAEAEGDPFTFTFGGEEYELPPNMDIRAVAEASVGNLEKAMRVMLGAQQWERILESDSVLDTRGLQGLLEAYARHSGLDIPNSLGSTGLLSSTAGPSKRTSNGRTTPRLRDSSRVS